MIEENLFCLSNFIDFPPQKYVRKFTLNKNLGSYFCINQTNSKHSISFELFYTSIYLLFSI